MWLEVWIWVWIWVKIWKKYDLSMISSHTSMTESSFWIWIRLVLSSRIHIQNWLIFIFTFSAVSILRKVILIFIFTLRTFRTAVYVKKMWIWVWFLRFSNMNMSMNMSNTGSMNMTATANSVLHIIRTVVLLALQTVLLYSK